MQQQILISCVAFHVNQATASNPYNWYFTVDSADNAGGGHSSGLCRLESLLVPSKVVTDEVTGHGEAA